MKPRSASLLRLAAALGALALALGARAGEASTDPDMVPVEYLVCYGTCGAGRELCSERGHSPLYCRGWFDGCMSGCLRSE